MNIVNRIGVVGLVLSWSCGMAYSEGAGTIGGTILGMAVGARAVAMGEAYTAVSDDVSSLYWNPAGLAIMNQGQTSFMYNQWVRDLTFQNASVAVPFEYGGMGASLSYLSYGDIDGFDDDGNPTSSVEANSGVATLGAGLFGDWWALGLSVKGVQETLADEKATGVAGDAGITVVAPREVPGGGSLRAAATVRNFGSGMKFLQERDPFPMEWRIGTALVQSMSRRLNVSLDYGKRRDEKGAFYTGVEYWIHRFVALRTGFSGRGDESGGLRAGIGLKMRIFSMDYAYSSYGDLGMVHRYEMSLRFGAIRPTLTPEQRKLYRQAKLDIAEERYGDAILKLDALIQTQASYAPFHRTLRVAMTKNEAQERLARSGRPAPIEALLGTRKTKGRGEDGIDQGELEQLLNMSEPSVARQTGALEKSR